MSADWKRSGYLITVTPAQAGGPERLKHGGCPPSRERRNSATPNIGIASRMPPAFYPLASDAMPDKIQKALGRRLRPRPVGRRRQSRIAEAAVDERDGEGRINW